MDVLEQPPHRTSGLLIPIPKAIVAQMIGISARRQRAILFLWTTKEKMKTSTKYSPSLDQRFWTSCRRSALNPAW